jgi:hypothetical protein
LEEIYEKYEEKKEQNVKEKGGREPKKGKLRLKGEINATQAKNVDRRVHIEQISAYLGREKSGIRKYLHTVLYGFGTDLLAPGFFRNRFFLIPVSCLEMFFFICTVPKSDPRNYIRSRMFYNL